MSESKLDNTDPEQTPDKEGGHDWSNCMTPATPLPVPPSVRVESGRPDLGAILRGEVSTATGSMAVTGGFCLFFFFWLLAFGRDVLT